MLDNNNHTQDVDIKKKFGTRHLQMLLLFLGVAVTCAGRFSISVAVVAMTDNDSTNSTFKLFDWDSEKKSLVLSSFFWGYVTMQIPNGYIANVYSAHKLLCFGVFISSIINAVTPLFAIQFDWISVVCCRIVMGLVQSCLIPSTHTILSKWIPPSERGRLGAPILFAPQFGNIISMTVSGLLAGSTLGWPSIFYVFGLAGILWSLLFYYVGADAPSKHLKICLEEKLYIENSLCISKDLCEAKKLNVPWKPMFTSVPVWTLIITRCGQAWGFYTFLTQLPSYIKHVLNYDIQESGLLSSLPYTVMLLVSIILSYVHDYILKKGMPVVIVRKVFNTIGMWSATIALIVLCFITTENRVIPIAILIITVTSEAGNMFGFEINHIDLSPNFAGTQIAIMNTIGNAVAQFAPIFCGYVVTDEANIKQWHIVFYTTAFVYFFANLVFIIFGKAEPQSWNEIRNKETVR